MFYMLKSMFMLALYLWNWEKADNLLPVYYLFIISNPANEEALMCKKIAFCKFLSKNVIMYWPTVRDELRLD